MLYSDAHKVAIFRIPKVASQSLSAALRSQGFCQHPSSEPRQWGCNSLKRLSLIDRTLSRHPAAASYKRASFVRHPETRLASAYRYISTKCPYIPEGKLPFLEFVAKVTSGESLFIGTLWHAGLTQTHLLSEGLVPHAKIGVQFVGKYEAIENDFADFLQWAGLTPATLPRVNESGPVTDYREWYTSHARTAVEIYFRDDYENFDYE
jgi:hypothetical protein